MKKHLSYMLFAIGALLYSCSSGTPTPEAPTAADSLCVYFDLRNESEFILDAIDTSFSIKVVRYDTAEVLDVPICVDSGCSPFLSIPDTVHFDKGKDWASLQISPKWLPLSQEQKLRISIDKKFASERISSLGQSSWEANVVIGQWMLVTDTARFDFKSKYGTVYSHLYKMKGQQIFKICNFMNSGEDLIYKIGKDSVNNEGDQEFIPMNLGYYVTNSTEGTSIIHMWNYDLYDGVGTFMSWQPRQGQPGIVRCYIYNYAPNTWYSFVHEYPDDKEGTTTVGCLYFWMYYEDGTSGWNPMTFSYHRK